MEAYIIKGYRSAVAKANKGGFKNYRSDDLAVEVIKKVAGGVVADTQLTAAWGGLFSIVIEQIILQVKAAKCVA